MIEIIDGLKQGETVVVSGGFLLDSESRLREALAKMVKGSLDGEQNAQLAQAPAQKPPLPDAAAKAIAGMVDDYLEIGTKLSSDTTDGIPAAAKQLAGNVDLLVKVDIPDDPHFWHNHTEAADVRGKALELAAPASIAQARAKFADLSVAASALLRATGVPASYGKQLDQLHCPMYRADTGGTPWLQPAGPVRNPYYGKKMLEFMGSGCPAMGMVGTLIGLVQMFSNMESPEKIGAGMAVALVCTFYGAFLANLFFLPMAGKLGIRSKKEGLIREMIAEGVVGIVRGDSPTGIREKMQAFISARHREELKPRI